MRKLLCLNFGTSLIPKCSKLILLINGLQNLKGLTMENKILEQPKWRLTQILLELEQAGLPKPDRVDGMAIKFGNYELIFNEETPEVYSIKIPVIRGMGLFTLPEAITKLKELLK